MITLKQVARTSLALVALGALGNAMAGDGLSRYYSLQNSAKYYSTASGSVGMPLVVIRYKDKGASDVASSSSSSSSKSLKSSGGSMVAPSSSSAQNSLVATADDDEALNTSPVGKASSLSSSYKTNTPTSGTGWSGFTNSGNYSIVTANGGVALNNVYVGGDLNITLNISGGSWTTNAQGGNCCCVSKS